MRKVPILIARESICGICALDTIEAHILDKLLDRRRKIRLAQTRLQLDEMRRWLIGLLPTLEQGGIGRGKVRPAPSQWWLQRHRRCGQLGPVGRSSRT